MDRICHPQSGPPRDGLLRRAMVVVLVALFSVSPAHAQLPISGMPAVAPMFEARGQALDCLTSAIAHEAGNEPLAGREAVAQVVMNRLRASAYPKTVCGVIFQGSTRRTGCQFTFTCDGALQRPLPKAIRDTARQIATAALDQSLPDRVGGATHYHAYYVAPSWASSLRKVSRIGAHIFYRPPGAQLASPSAPPPVVIADTPVPPPPPAAGPVFSAWGLPLGNAE
jgi:hypothetical protein